jgi:hypothetical protein
VVNEGTWYIGWDIPQPMINGLMRTISMLLKPCNSTLIRSRSIRIHRIVHHVRRHVLRNIVPRILRHVIRSRIMTPRRKTTPQSRNLRREGCKVTRQRASRALQRSHGDLLEQIVRSGFSLDKKQSRRE